MSENFKEKLKKQILHTEEKVSIITFFNKKRLEDRIDFSKLSKVLLTKIENGVVDDQVSEHFYNQLYTMCNIFLEYNENVKKISEIELSKFHTTGFDVKKFEYAETLILEKSIKNFSNNYKNNKNLEILNDDISNCRVNAKTTSNHKSERIM